MVRFRNLSAYDGVVPEQGADRRIARGPLYGMAKVKEIAGNPKGILLWTEKCVQDVASLNFEMSDVMGLFQVLKETDYDGSEWCGNGKGGWAACDVYLLQRTEFIEHAQKHFLCRYYLKFAVSSDDTILLMASCHLSN